MSIPPSSGQFSSEQHAREHLCNHVLTPPESHDWAVILPSYVSLVSPSNLNALTALGTSLLSSSPCREGLVLLREYVEALQQAIEDALRLGWWWEVRQGNYREWIGLGLEGVHVFWNSHVIKTGLFPGSASPRRGEQKPRRDNPLPRRRRAERLRPAPADSPRRRYELFRMNHYCVSKSYANAYLKGEVSQAGGKIFVDPVDTPRIGKWEQWLRERGKSPETEGQT